MDNKVIKRLTPLTEATYYILIAFYKPLHGYGVIKKVEELTNQRLKLAAGTLYGVINSLLSNKLIRLYSENIDNKKKKEYVITDFGKQILEHELLRLEEMLNNGRKVI